VPLTVDGWGVLLFAVPWFFVSYGLIAYNVAQISFRQRMCPPELMSRMNATVRFVVWGLLPLGGVAGGVLGDWLGVRVALLLAGVGMTSSVGWILLSPLRSMREFPALTPAGQNDAR
jgi:hypothetical protein